ncbi:MAG: hypothetical protein ACQEXX_24095 [Bacillota bacterium]
MSTIQPSMVASLKVLKIWNESLVLGDHVAVIDVGGQLTPDDVVQALGTGVPLVALGHAMILNPDWVTMVQSVQNGKKWTATLYRL